MDLRQFGIDERLLSGAPVLAEQSAFHEKMLSHALLKGENVCAKITISADRESIWLLPALQWLASAGEGDKRRVLAVVPDAAATRRCIDAAAVLGKGLSLRATDVEELPSGMQDDSDILVGSLSVLLQAQAEGRISLHDFGFLLVDGGERIAELPSEELRKLQSSLLPSWERKTVFACSKISVKAKNLAWDLSDNPVEIQIEEDAARAFGIAQETWHIASDQKLRFLLGLLARRRPSRTCVFCNLKNGADELALRLRHNGLEAHCATGPLDSGKMAALKADLEAEAGSILVLTDEGAAGLVRGGFPLVVNFDFPLDPELYVTRLAMLAGNDKGSAVVNLACERYVYGLPAVERRIDAKLDAQSAPESLLLAEDKSAFFMFELPSAEKSDGRAAPRAGRLVAVHEVKRNEGQDARRDFRPSRSDRDQRGARQGPASRDRNDRRGAPDRSPDIQRSIADATGGSLDVSSLQPRGEERPAGANGRKSGKPGGENAGGRNKAATGRGKSARSPNSRAQGGPPLAGKEKGAGAEGKGGRRPADASRRPPSGAARPEASARNPYDLSTEERMRLYREKYQPSGRASKAGPPGDGPAKGTAGKKGKGRRQTQDLARKDSGVKSPAPSRGQGAKAAKPVQQGHKPAPKKGSASRPPFPPAGKVRSPENMAPAPKRGFFRRLFGGSGK